MSKRTNFLLEEVRSTLIHKGKDELPLRYVCIYYVESGKTNSERAEFVGGGNYDVRDMWKKIHTPGRLRILAAPAERDGQDDWGRWINVDRIWQEDTEHECEE